MLLLCSWGNTCRVFLDFYFFILLFFYWTAIDLECRCTCRCRHAHRPPGPSHVHCPTNTHAHTGAQNARNVQLPPEILNFHLYNCLQTVCSACRCSKMKVGTKWICFSEFLSNRRHTHNQKKKMFFFFFKYKIEERGNKALFCCCLFVRFGPLVYCSFGAMCQRKGMHTFRTHFWPISRII